MEFSEEALVPGSLLAIFALDYSSFLVTFGMGLVPFSVMYLLVLIQIWMSK
jgi:hypothetical protein